MASLENFPHNETTQLTGLATTTLSRQPFTPRVLPATTRTKFSLRNLNPFRQPPKPDPATKDLDDHKVRERMSQSAAKPKLSSSIFEDEVAATEESEQLGVKEARNQQVIRPGHLAPTQDPDPRSRVRWERKAVMRMVRRNGRESRREIIRRTEREMRFRSPFLPTSVKKLMHISRQVAGKNVDDALVQMRYSKKKMSREVGHFLGVARDRAVVEHGMGLGKPNGEILEKPRKIKDSEGNWMVVSDPTRIYIAQAWVGRGPWRGQRLVHLGRGRKSVHMKPSTSMFSPPLFPPLHPWPVFYPILIRPSTFHARRRD